MEKQKYLENKPSHGRETTNFEAIHTHARYGQKCTYPIQSSEACLVSLLSAELRSNRKMCIVSVFELETRYSAHVLNDSDAIETQRLRPRLNSNNFVPSNDENTRITVPRSLAVAISVPEGLKANAANGLSWAGIIVFACKLMASKICTSPEVTLPG